MDDLDPNNSDDIWVFGYGSLVWKVDFLYEKSQTGYIKGYERRFYQNSIDHRGTPENPGRVVTLIPSNEQSSVVWGIGYKIASDKINEVLKHLDYREKNGYERHVIKFYPYPIDETNVTNESAGAAMINIIIYVANKDNQSYAGDRNNLSDIVDQIYNATGPSGTNREYVYRLADAMRHYFPGQSDQHLYSIESMLRDREQKTNEHKLL